MDQLEKKDPDHIKHALSHAFAHMEDMFVGHRKISYRVMTGLNTLDKLTNGFRNGDLIAICGQPGVGKSAFALSLACGVATRYQNMASVLMFSTQSMASQLALRSVIAGARGTYSNIPQGIIRHADWSKLACSAGRLSDLHLAINDTVTTMDEIIIYGRERKRDHENTCLSILDSMDSITGENPARYADTLIRLKNLARELGLPIIVTSAVGENIKFRNPLYDLLEKYSDVIMQLNRHEVSSDIRYVDKDGVYSEVGQNGDLFEKFVIAESIVKWKMEIAFLKNKNGPNGSFNLDFLPQLSRFTGV